MTRQQWLENTKTLSTWKKEYHMCCPSARKRWKMKMKEDEDEDEFKKMKKFVTKVKQFKVNESTMVFKINIFKFIDKYPKLMKPLLSLNFLKTYLKDIKNFFLKTWLLFWWQIWMSSVKSCGGDFSIFSRPVVHLLLIFLKAFDFFKTLSFR